MTLNGAKTSDRTFLDPGFTSYDETVLYTTDDVTSLIRQDASAAGENVHRVAVGSGPVRQRDDLRRLGLVDRRVARQPDAARRPVVTLRRRHRAGRQVRRELEDQRRGPDPLRQPLPRRDLRRAPRARGLEHARLRRRAPGPRRAACPARPACCARRTSSARRWSATIPAGTRTEPQPRHLRLGHRPAARRLGDDQRQRRARRHADPDPLRREARRQRPGLHLGLRARGPDPDRLLHRQGHRHARPTFTPQFTYKGFQCVQISAVGGTRAAGRRSARPWTPCRRSASRCSRPALRHLERPARPDQPQHQSSIARELCLGRDHRHADLREERLGR